MKTDVEFTAIGSGQFVLRVDGVEVSRHTTEREAAENAIERKLAEPAAAVEYVHDYRVTVEAKQIADPVPPPPPPPPVPAGPQPVVVELFDYPGLAEYAANPLYGPPQRSPLVAVSIDDVGPGPWGSSRALGFHISPSQSGSIDFAEIIRFPRALVPAGTREIWFEWFNRWAPGYKTDIRPGSNPDQKLIFYGTDFWPQPQYPGSGRFSTKVGTNATAYSRVMSAAVDGMNQVANGGGDAELSDYQEKIPPRTGTPVYPPIDLFNGAWQEFRTHWRAPSPGVGDGILRRWINRQQTVDRRGWGMNIGATGGFTHLELGRYLNQAPDFATSFWFAGVRVWITDPGW